MSRVSAERRAALAAILADPRVWRAPWTARRSEIDCPCPNGEHCGDTHDCVEVEAREEYPNGAPGAPAAEGEGQCVVQISVPGLDHFAFPTAEAICALRNAGADLLSDIADAEAERDALRRHYDAAGPEHNLLALLDLYHERTTQAEAERDRLQGVVDTISEATMESICDEDIIEHIIRDHGEIDYVASHLRACAKQLDNVGKALSRYAEERLDAQEALTAAGRGKDGE